MPGEVPSHESIKITSSNVHRNRALNDPGSLDQLLPSDRTTPTITAFQEAFPWRGDVAKQIEDRGYQAILPSSPLGLAFALSPDLSPVEVDTVEEFPFERKGLLPPSGVADPRRRFGVFVLRRVNVGKQKLSLAVSQEPGATSPWRTSVVDFKMRVMAYLADQDPLLLDGGDRNHLFFEQIRDYHHRAARWGGVALFPDGEPTYLLKNNPYFRRSQGRAIDPQLDGMHLSLPDNLSLVAGQTSSSSEVGYETQTREVSSDHLALEAILHLPAGANESDPQTQNVPIDPGRDMIVVQTPPESPKNVNKARRKLPPLGGFLEHLLRDSEMRVYQDPDTYEEGAYSFRRDNLARGVADVLQANTPDHATNILEIGAGTGILTLELVGRGFSVTAVDLHESQLRKLQTKTAPDITERVTAVQTNMNQGMPFQDDSFDSVVSLRASRYITDLDRWLAEAARVLRSNGTFVLPVFSLDTLPWRRNSKEGWRQRTDVRAISHRVIAAGLEPDYAAYERYDRAVDLNLGERDVPFFYKPTFIVARKRTS